MACKIELIGSITGVAALKSFLLKSGKAEDIDEEWWREDPQSVEESEDASQSAIGNAGQFLEKCHVTVSPLGDLIVFASFRRAAILSGRWDSDCGYTRFPMGSACKRVRLEADSTAVLCLPMASGHRSSPSGTADWTCVLFGLSSGAICFSTEDGWKLFSQQLHTSPVLELRCSAAVGHAAPHDTDQQLTVVYSDVIVLVDAFALYQTLRVCRNQLAKSRAGSGSTFVAPPPLAFRKWELRRQELVSSAVVLGPKSPLLFDHLAAESLARPRSAVGRSTVPAATVILTAGRCPYIGFYHATERVQEAHMNQVVRDVASKVKDTVFSTIGSLWGSAAVPPAGPARDYQETEPAIPAVCKFGISDLRRCGRCITVSLNRRLSAVTDSFGRVALLDNHRSVVIRMWKGYRDAQCGWLQVREPRSALAAPQGDQHRSLRSPSHRAAVHASFLVLYAPRRGLLEVWPTAVGDKTAAFTVPKHSRLLSIDHGLLGPVVDATSASAAGRSSVRGIKPLQCVFITADGHLSTISVPFHLAVSGGDGGARVHDQHVMRELRAVLRSGPIEQLRGQLTGKLAELKTTSVQLHALHVLLKSSRAAAADMLAGVETLLVASESQLTDGSEGTDAERKNLVQVLTRYQRLLTCYTALTARSRDTTSGSSQSRQYKTTDDESDTQSLCRLLRVNAALFTSVVSSLTTNGRSKSPEPGAGNHQIPVGHSAATGVDCSGAVPRVSFAVDEEEHASEDLLKPSEFLSCMDGIADGNVIDHTSVNSGVQHRLSQLMFSSQLSAADVSGHDGSWWTDALQLSGLSRSQLLSLLAMCWLSVARSSSTAVDTFTGGDVRRLHTTLSTVCTMPLNGDVNALSWRDVVRCIRDSCHVRRAFLLAVSCRAVSLAMELTPTVSPSHRKCAEVQSCDAGPPDAGDSAVMDDSQAITATSDVPAAAVTGDTSMTDNSPAVTTASDAPAAAMSAVAQPLDTDWETMTQQSISWDLLLHQLDDVIVVYDVIGGSEEVSLSSLLQSGPGSVSELLARRFIAESVTADDLASLRPSAPEPKAPAEEGGDRRTVEERSQQLEEEEDTPSSLTEPTHAIQSSTTDTLDICPTTVRRRQLVAGWIAAVCTRFPHSVEPDVLSVNCAWEQISAWHKCPEHTEKLSSGVQFIANVSCPTLRQGVCVLVWSAFVRGPCASLVGLVNQLGHIPDTHQCHQLLQLPAELLTSFIDDSYRLLQQLLESAEETNMMSCRLADDGGAPSARAAPPAATQYHDNLWTTDAYESGRGAASLVRLCGRQRLTGDLGTVRLHLQMLQLLRIVSHLLVRDVRPWLCFSRQTESVLFGELSASGPTAASAGSSPSQLVAVDQQTMSRREQLLCAAVSRATQRVYQHADGRAESGEASRWIATCLELAQSWDVDPDLIQRHYTLELFSNGHDQLAHEIWSSLPAAGELFSSQLLLLAASRLRYYIYVRRAQHMTQLLGRLTNEAARFISTATLPLESYCASMRQTRDLLARLSTSLSGSLLLDAQSLLDVTESLMADESS